MQRSASPDITEGPAGPPPERERRPVGRPPGSGKKSTSETNSPVTPPAQSPNENEPKKAGRGRGRPKKSTEPAQSGGPPPPTTTPSAAAPAAVPAQQPKRRGRKPRVLKEIEDTAEFALARALKSSTVPSEGVSMDTTTSADSAQNPTFQANKIPQVGEDSSSGTFAPTTPMETEESQGQQLVNKTGEVSSLFSSVMTSEPFGLRPSGGGIPGLDLDDCDASSGLFSGGNELGGEPPRSFLFGGPPISGATGGGVDEECRGMEQLQISSVSVKAAEVPTPKVPEESDKAKKEETPSGEDGENARVRRSSRIKTLEEQRGSRGRRREVVSSLSETSGLSRSSVSLHEDDSNSNSSNSMQTGQNSGYSSPSRDSGLGGMSSSSSAPNLSSLSSGSSSSSSKPLKVKSRWRYSLDAESMKTSSSDTSASILATDHNISAGSDAFVPSENLVRRKGHLAFDASDEELLDKLKRFEGIDESLYRTERKISKENRGMVCDCYLSSDDVLRGETGCSEDCLNRLLMVECGNRCPTEERCSNKRFQKKEYASLEVFKTEKKGHGLRTLQHIPEGGFVIEYVGEVLDVPGFERRTTEYAKGNQEHFYFMALKSDAIIDATQRGNCSRFINHSCEPNCETQKWTVNGEVRIGFFTITDLQPGDEITFDYQFQRYGKKAQKCYCMAEGCRGWIGEEEDENEVVDEKEESSTPGVAGVEVEDKVKPKPKVERKKRKNVQLEDTAFREELAKLEASGLKNRNHTLTLSRLMVRAESWDDRERMLRVLLNGDSPCRRLFLDYHGLRLIWSWMVDLPLPHESEGPQLIRNDVYHLLFLQALQSLPIPNKTMLLDSKVLALVEKWGSAPALTSTTTLVIKRSETPIPTPPPPAEIKKTEENATIEETVTIKIETTDTVEKMETVEIKEEPTSTEGMQEVVDERSWEFVPLSKTLLESWADLKEVFRIPKKERVEQMKEHEREADKGQNTAQPPSGTTLNSSYDRDHRNKQYRGRGERRVPVLDPTQQQYHHRYPPNRMVMPPGVTKEQWRKHFEQSVREREEQEMLRKQQDALVTLHQERCALVGLDPATTPIVDPHGVHYLDPKTVMWKSINIEDPTMPPELIKFVQLSQYPPPVSEVPVPVEPVVFPAEEPEQAFPPWPVGLPPPPPLPPSELPKNWRMTVDDEGRCYYYHTRTKVTRWDPPFPEDVSSTESSDSSDSSTEGEEGEEVDSPSITKAKILTWRTKLNERAAKRKKSGLVQERIISPRGDDDKGFSKEMVKENKKKALEEKLARLSMKDKPPSSEKESTDGDEEVSVSEPPTTEILTEEVSEDVVVPPKKSSAPSKKRRKEKPRSSRSQPQGKPKQKPVAAADGSEENLESSSPIETELDLTLSQQSMEEENEGFFSRVSAGPSRIIGSTPSMDVVMIPGLGFDRRDLDAKKKAERAARHAAKKKAMSMQKVKHAKEKHESKHVHVSSVPSSSGGAGGSEKKISSKELSTIKDTFRNSIATVVVAHLNPYRKSEHIKSTEDFKHLARKITHAILLKELKHTRDVSSLEVTESVKHKTKEFIKKFMAKLPSGAYVRSPDNQQSSQQ